MSTKKSKSWLLYGLQFLVSVLFLGSIGYYDLFHDNAASAEASLSTQITQVIQVDEQPVLPDNYYGLKRAEVALGEYRKGVTESPMGCNCGPVVDIYTESNSAPWCAMFASWVAREAGSPFMNEQTHSWRFTRAREIETYLESTGTWYSRDEVIAGEIKPKPGDYMVFWRGRFEGNLGHVDIVIDPEVRPGFVGVVGGNVEGKVQYRELPYLQHYGFLGFGRPEKEVN